MLTPEEKISVNVMPVEIFEYDSGSVAFLNPQLPTWVRTSSTGLWIFQYLKQNASTVSETASAVALHYGLPTDVVQESVIRFLGEMMFNGFLILQGSDDKERPSIISKVVELSDVGLHELCLDITALCHGACQHCYKPKKGACHFPVSELEGLLVQAKTLGAANLIITGGEPLLHPQFSRIMMLARRVSDWTIKVITAGQSRSSEILDALMENADILQVSLDGLDKATNDLIRGEGAFECAVTLLKLLYEHKNTHRKKVGIAFTPLPQNINQIEEMSEWAYRLGIDFIHFNHLTPRANLSRDIPKDDGPFSQDLFKKCLRSFNELTVKMWNELHGILRDVKPVSVDQSFAPYHDLFSLLKKHNCGAGISTLSITEKGDVYPCVALQAFPETYLGNWIRQRDLPELYSRARRWSESVFSVDACQQCKACHLRYLCGGGCRARADSLAGPDIMCEAIRKSYDEFFETAEILVKTRTNEEIFANISDREIEANDKQGKSQFKPKQCT
jgi:radical SAM protein with 4Fe4S-binding SPASM domain